MAETEKITINLSVVDLGKVDLLVEEGFYATRTDFIKDCVRRGLDQHRDDLQRKVVERRFVAGIIWLSAKDLRSALSEGKRLNIRALGMVSLSDDITPELAQEAIERIEVRGVLRARPELKEALRDRVA